MRNFHSLVRNFVNEFIRRQSLRSVGTIEFAEIARFIESGSIVDAIKKLRSCTETTVHTQPPYAGDFNTYWHHNTIGMTSKLRLKDAKDVIDWLKDNQLAVIVDNE